ncbi:MAG: DnaD domain protein [Clostridia bacterium]|nr:DnaD domain protein [Clostridia bacterium]
MKITVKYSGGIINLPDTVALHLNEAGEAEMKVIIGIFAFSSHFNDFEMALPLLAERLDLTLNEVSGALKFWQGAGVLSIEGAVEPTASAVSAASAKTNEAPSYTGEQILRMVDKNPDFKMLADCAMGVLGKDFTPTDFNSLLEIKEFYGFSDEYILMLLQHCCESDRASWAYIRKTSKILYDEGVDTYEKLEAHLAARKNKRSFEYKIRKLFGVGYREFTKRERTYFDKWVELKHSFDLVKRAYEISIDNGKGTSWSYIGKILENWHTQGIKTVEDAEKSLASYKSKTTMSSFDTDEFFEAALKRSSERIKERSKE